MMLRPHRSPSPLTNNNRRVILTMAPEYFAVSVDRRIKLLEIKRDVPRHLHTEHAGHHRPTVGTDTDADRLMGDRRQNVFALHQHTLTSNHGSVSFTGAEGFAHLSRRSRSSRRGWDTPS